MAISIHRDGVATQRIVLELTLSLHVSVIMELSVDENPAAVAEQKPAHVKTQTLTETA